MPELPDVESYRHQAQRTALHRFIDQVSVKEQSLLQAVSPQTLRRHLLRHQFMTTARRGKYLDLETDEGRHLVLHFGMTGELQAYDGSEPSYSALDLKFKGDHHLAYTNKRKLGGIWLVDDFAQFIADRNLGPDALDISLSDCKEILDQHGGASLKNLLMDQQAMAGIGNIYSDEILFRSRLQPARKAESLSTKEQAQLFRAIRYVLQRAIKDRADPDNFPRTWLIPHRQKGGRCPRCNHKLVRLQKGRTSYHCGTCQK